MRPTILLATLAATVPLLAACEEKLPELKVGIEDYRDVTVTEVTPTHIYFSHNHGLGTAKLKALEPAMQEHFHFDPLKAEAFESEQAQANALYQTQQAQADTLYRRRKLQTALLEVFAALFGVGLVLWLCSWRIRQGLRDLINSAIPRPTKARDDEANAQRILALTKVAEPFGEEVACDARTGDPQPVSIDREGKFSLQAKPFSEELKLEIETSPETAGKIAALLAGL